MGEFSPSKFALRRSRSSARRGRLSRQKARSDGGTRGLQTPPNLSRRHAFAIITRKLDKACRFDVVITLGPASLCRNRALKAIYNEISHGTIHIRQIEYGIAENDIQNRFALSLNYELQYGKNFTGARKFALGGWQVNTITAWQSGKPFTITETGSGADNRVESDGKQHGYNNRATPLNNGGQDRPDQIKDARLSHKSQTEFFDVTACAPQPLGTVGSAQRNSLFGPHFRHVDLSIFKDFPVTERVKVQFRAEAFNISNTPNFYIGNGSRAASFGNPAFGAISQTDLNYTPREFQFALKAHF